MGLINLVLFSMKQLITCVVAEEFTYVNFETTAVFKVGWQIRKVSKIPPMIPPFAPKFGRSNGFNGAVVCP